MCHCTPEIRTPFCGRPGCEWPEPKHDEIASVAPRDLYVVMLWHPVRLWWTLPNFETCVCFDPEAARKCKERFAVHNPGKVFKVFRYAADAERDKALAALDGEAQAWSEFVARLQDERDRLLTETDYLRARLHQANMALGVRIPG